MSKENLGNRIKSYEDSYRIKLPMRMPIILRLDGVAFHSYTKGLKRPVDENLVSCMNDTAIYLCKNIQGAKLSFVQSDEISILIYNNQFETQSWFDNNLQKTVSVSAAKASSYFSSISDRIFGKIKLAAFDARAFILPNDEVCNYFIWRQQDATRNSVQMLARSLYSHKALENKNNSELQELCFQKGINWNDCPISQRRGRCLVKTQVWKEGLNPKTGETIEAMRSEWVVDESIPIFSKDRSYIDQHILSNYDVVSTVTV
jgi:tRNA(His) 5'-end guanylyltransferase